MKDFEYVIAGVNYRVPGQVIVGAVRAVQLEAFMGFADDFSLLYAAEKAFMQAIKGELYLDDSRSYHHSLYIDGQLVWEHDWKVGPIGDFDMGDFYEALEVYLRDVGLIGGDDIIGNLG